MSEFFYLKTEHSVPDAPEAAVSEQQVSTLLMQGFTVQQAAHLLYVRARYAQGELKEHEQAYRRLCFARWLRERGYITD